MTKQGSEVVEVSDDVWQKIQKQIQKEPRPDPAAEKKLKEELEKMNKAPDNGGKPPVKR